MYQDIKVERSGAVVIIVLSRPHRLNALTTRMLAEVEHAVLAAVEERARAILLTGEGQFFSVGTDMEPDGDAYTGLTDDLGAVLEQRANPLMKLLADLPMPLVCSVNGPAIGAAVGLALMGDLLVMGQRSYLQLAQVGVGLVPDTGATWLVARSMGRARAMQMALFGERLGANEAKAAGIAASVMPDSFVRSEALALASRLAEGPTRAMGAIRRQINYAMDHDLADVLAFEAEQQRACGRTQDFAAARAALGSRKRTLFIGQ
ncbi:enoyl-CoA hydratase-related protein [Novosphingobium sp. KACC 22771]|uniref:enoyl-CoA hydratase-related protein n=1 Tax=Novosphingobium sp. KACC 22771 TaxID=3025670 RepID=UPI002365A7E8|nr:enoyl-CoA hydratase-related protein [Novosphingobium sp. KACC 22771]WDF74366.1 enoyl-CoA hydratase-related protein [Novosphingobium sp. KACC 22771]